MASSLEIRDDLARVLQLDLIGPSPGSSYETEQLDIAPSRFYLSGFLVPHEADEEWKSARDGQENTTAEEGDGSGDDEAADEKASARKVFFPSSMGLSVCVRPGTKELTVTATWGEYEPLEVEKKKGEGEAPDAEAGGWKRVPHSVTKTIALKSGPVDLDARGVRLSVVVRDLKLEPTLAADAGLTGVRAVSIFLVNDRKPDTTRKRDQFFLFQTKLIVSCGDGFAARPDLRGLHSRLSDADEAIADLQYRDSSEYAVGHGVGAQAIRDAEGCRDVRTAWIPGAEVHKVDAARLPGDFDMKRLADAASPEALIASLTPLTVAYRAWIDVQRQTPGLSAHRKDISKTLLDEALLACGRIEAGLTLLKEPKVFRAFTLANAAMEAQARRRNLQRGDTTTSPTWRPFQLAFVLMNLRGVVDPKHVDREVVDLLFFPTGGGKTEAYLGLAAFTLVYRRLTHEGVHACGVSVLMRYTLRLLTLDQLQRAATLVCALELAREKLKSELGEWPFEIGLWVGRAATPNRMGRVGEQDENSARSRVLAYQRDTKRPLPIPLETCPWCGGAFTASSFMLEPTEDEPLDLRIRCVNRGACEFVTRTLRC
jgi:hypothetical protein